MDEAARITEIDIGRPTRVLSWLRLTDYALVVLCGLGAVGLLSGFVEELPAVDPYFLAIASILLPLFCFSAYTGWRHVGVIEPAVWRTYAVLFPLLAAVCLCFAGLMAVEKGSPAGLAEWNRSELAGFFQELYIGGTALLGWVSLLLLQRMRIPGMGGTVEEAVRSVYREAGRPPEKTARIRRIDTPRGVFVGAAGVLLLAAVLFAPEPRDPDLADAAFRLGQQASLLAFFLLVRARRYFQVDADALLAVDRRPPVLFLRSFDDDEKQKFTRSDKALLDFSLKTRLSNHFSRFGPFIAIGSPKEKVPQLGAARVRLSDEEWQPRVLGWMREAQLVVMYSGKTHWVNWELRQVVENGCATHLILMIPEIRAWRRRKREGEIGERLAQVREVFRSTPWEEELLAFDDVPGLRAMVFRPDGSMVMVKSRSRSRDAYHLAALVAHAQLLAPGAAGDAREEDDAARRPRRWPVAAGVLAGGALVALATAFLFPRTGTARLSFLEGEVVYRPPVAREEARKIGAFLVREAFFTEEAGSTVQLGREDGRYRIGFVIRPKFAEDPLTAVQFGAIAGRISREALDGAPVAADLLDEHLGAIRGIASGGVLAYGPNELYHTEPVSGEDAGTLGEWLVENGFFSEDRGASVLLGREDAAYRLQFVIDPALADDPEVRASFLEVGRLVAAGPLRGRPLEVHLCDGRFRTLFRERMPTTPER